MMINWFRRFRRRVPTRAAAAPSLPAGSNPRDAGTAGRPAGGATDTADALRRLDDHPDDPSLNVLGGEAHLADGDAEAALDLFHLALHYEPGNAAALDGRVRALARLGRTRDLPGACRDLLAVAPAHRGALYTLALAAERDGRFDEALELLERLVAHHPADADALSFLGLLRARERGEFAAGEALLRQALELAPADANAAANLGWVLAESGKPEEGLALLDRLLAAQPGDAEVRLMRALVELKRGNFAPGWRDYGARFKSALATPRPFRFPDLGGEAPAGKRVLVYGEQGLGDQIMFASCLPELLAEAASCVIDCDPRLAALFARSFPTARVFGTVQDDPAPAWLGAVGPLDAQVPVGALPARYRRRREDFPAHSGYLTGYHTGYHTGYLTADPARVAHYAGRLRSLGPGLKVGLSWRGGTKTSRRGLRSLALDALAPLIASVPAQWVSLQYTRCDDEIAAMAARTGVTVHHWQAAIDDYEDTAALVCALDAVVTVCTAVVHLAGALGRRALVMVPAAAEWRYGAEGDRMPWYPSVRLVRQERPGEWGTVLEQVGTALRATSQDG